MSGIGGREGRERKGRRRVEERCEMSVAFYRKCSDVVAAAEVVAIGVEVVEAVAGRGQGIARTSLRFRRKVALLLRRKYLYP